MTKAWFFACVALIGLGTLSMGDINFGILISFRNSGKRMNFCWRDCLGCIFVKNEYHAACIFLHTSGWVALCTSGAAIGDCLYQADNLWVTALPRFKLRSRFYSRYQVAAVFAQHAHNQMENLQSAQLGLSSEVRCYVQRDFEKSLFWRFGTLLGMEEGSKRAWDQNENGS